MSNIWALFHYYSGSRITVCLVLAILALWHTSNLVLQDAGLETV